MTCSRKFISAFILRVDSNDFLSPLSKFEGNFVTLRCEVKGIKVGVDKGVCKLGVRSSLRDFLLTCLSDKWWFLIYFLAIYSIFYLSLIHI